MIDVVWCEPECVADDDDAERELANELTSFSIIESIGLLKLVVEGEGVVDIEDGEGGSVGKLSVSLEVVMELRDGNVWRLVGACETALVGTEGILHSGEVGEVTATRMVVEILVEKIVVVLVTCVFENMICVLVNVGARRTLLKFGDLSVNAASDVTGSTRDNDRSSSFSPKRHPTL
ncbi:hypothetical protein BDQ17DRAFT_1432342 [Cyathus striatus]|nr:hypothetical protein BDQ17DRAFT_1432342 [Cyathus striatus]